MTDKHYAVDETLGGLMREYEVSTTTDVKVGDYIRVKEDGADVTSGAFYKVETVNSEGSSLRIRDDAGDNHRWDIPHVGYDLFEKTDVVVYEGKRYKLVDRKAEKGELVIHFHEGESDGVVTEVLGVTFYDVKVSYIDEEDDEVVGINHGAYLVLVPEKERFSDEDSSRFLTESYESAQHSIEYSLAHLALKVVELERTVSEQQRKLSEAQTLIDGLYADLREVETTTDEHAETLAKVGRALN